MAVEDSSVVDAVGINEESGSIELYINDDLDWSNENEENHLVLLQDKISMYLQFIIEEQIYEVFSSEEDKKRKRYIIVNFTHDLSTNAFEILEFYRLNLTQNNILLGWVIEKTS